MEQERGMQRGGQLNLAGNVNNARIQQREINQALLNDLIGIGQGKSKQVPDAIKKATEVAKRNLIKIPLKDGRTLHHDVNGKNGSGKVFMRSAPAGTGIIAGGPIRSACEVLGIQDVVAKSLGSSNPYNVLKACVKGLATQTSPKLLSATRGKTISNIISKREN